LHFINAENSPGVKTSGGIVSHIMTEVDISCLPGDLPEYIQVDLMQLAAGHTLHLSDLALPKGVEIVALARGDNAAVVTIVIPRSVLTEEGAGEAAGAEKK
jgi:large subunit ribosomal protein L25